ncbi:MAG: hypothetical protein RJQ04_05280 [Longimicrobiales bacterium]
MTKRWRRGSGTLVAAVLAGLGAAAPAAAQELADFDYENLRFRGVGLDWGYMWPTRVEPTQSWGIRMDLGYLGPGVRVLPSLSYWSAAFKSAEVSELEGRVAELIATQTEGPAPDVDLGVIEWSDIKIGMDAQVVWDVPGNLLTFAGLGAAAHLLNGDGAAINGTFIEDLLDSVTAGFNLHAGLEYPVSNRVRLHGQGRYEVLGDLRYLQVRTGIQFMFGDRMPGEERTR